MVIWRFGPDGSFRGPEPMTGFEAKGTDGRFNYIELPAKQQSLTGTSNRPFAIADGRSPKPVLPPKGTVMRFITASATPGFGPRLFIARPDPALPERDLQERWEARGTHLVRAEGYKEGRWAIPWAGLTVLGDEGAVTIQDRVTRSSVEVVTRAVTDFPGLESVSLDKYGWLFVENDGADYAIKLQRRQGRIEVAHVTQYSGEGWLGRLVRFVFGLNKGARIDERHWSAQCADYSAALRLTFLCKPFRVLRDGKPMRVEGPAPDNARWKGDATRAAAAILEGPLGRGLYVTDGRTSRMLLNGHVPYGTVQDLPESGRTFLFASKRHWEIVGTYPWVRLRAVNFRASAADGAPFNCCLSQYGVSNVRFVSLPGTSDVLAFHSTLGIWRLGTDRAQLLWRAGNSAIDLKSVSPAKVWNGTIFLSEDKTPFLVKPCRR